VTLLQISEPMLADIGPELDAWPGAAYSIDSRTIRLENCSSPSTDRVTMDTIMWLRPGARSARCCGLVIARTALPECLCADFCLVADDTLLALHHSRTHA